MTEWLDYSVQVEVGLPIEQVWPLWADVEQMPRWMKWIDSVEIVPENPELSRWRFASGIFEFSWQTKILQQIPEQIIEWESVDGLPNRGAIRFYDRNESSIVKLSISFGLPSIVANLIDLQFLTPMIESTLQADLERFREYALNTQAVANAAELD
jgi:uncharacterized membrane protein